MHFSRTLMPKRRKIQAFFKVFKYFQGYQGPVRTLFSAQGGVECLRFLVSSYTIADTIQCAVLWVGDHKWLQEGDGNTVESWMMRGKKFQVGKGSFLPLLTKLEMSVRSGLNIHCQTILIRMQMMKAKLCYFIDDKFSFIHTMKMQWRSSGDLPDYFSSFKFSLRVQYVPRHISRQCISKLNII